MPETCRKQCIVTLGLPTAQYVRQPKSLAYSNPIPTIQTPVAVCTIGKPSAQNSTGSAYQRGYLRGTHARERPLYPHPSDSNRQHRERRASRLIQDLQRLKRAHPSPQTSPVSPPSLVFRRFRHRQQHPAMRPNRRVSTADIQTRARQLFARKQALEMALGSLKPPLSSTCSVAAHPNIPYEHHGPP